MSKEKIGGWSFLVLGALVYTFLVNGTLNDCITFECTIGFAIGVMIIPTVVTLLIVKFSKANFLITAIICSLFFYGISYWGSTFTAINFN